MRKNGAGDEICVNLIFHIILKYDMRVKLLGELGELLKFLFVQYLAYK